MRLIDEVTFLAVIRITAKEIMAPFFCFGGF